MEPILPIQPIEARHAIATYLGNHHLAVISTANIQGAPQSAVIGYSCTGDLEIVFTTYADSRKVINLKKNPRVSLVIGWDGGRTLQYEGEAHLVVGAQAVKLEEFHYNIVPTAAKYTQPKKQILYKITPKWIRLTDFHQDPWQVWEVRV
ncbi:MAG: pyridoxamine 5'-phosphate oxidase family protein [Candidatus Roizmanbacteria bacterium]